MTCIWLLTCPGCRSSSSAGETAAQPAAAALVRLQGGGSLGGVPAPALAPAAVWGGEGCWATGWRGGSRGGAVMVAQAGAAAPQAEPQAEQAALVQGPHAVERLGQVLGGLLTQPLGVRCVSSGEAACSLMQQFLPHVLLRRPLSTTMEAQLSPRQA